MFLGVDWWDLSTLPLWAAAKATLIFTLAVLINLRTFRTSAATRHTVWFLALLCSLLLPIVIVTAPAWRVVDNSGGGSIVPQHVDYASVAHDESGALELQPDEPPTETGLTAAPNDLIQADRSDPVVQVDGERQRPASDATRQTTWVPKHLPQILLTTWLGGFVVVGGYWLLGLRRLQGLIKRAGKVTGGDFGEMFDQLVAQFGIQSRPVLLRSNQIPVPMTCMSYKPVVLVPLEAWSWSPKRQRMVLMHELAHVKRQDCLAMAVGYLACAVFWFHPMVWWLAGRMRDDAEVAADDLVVTNGYESPEQYADELLGIVRDLRIRNDRWLCAIPMARPSQLEQRIRSVLDRRSNRRISFVWILALILPLLGFATLATARIPMPSEPRIDVPLTLATMIQKLSARDDQPLDIHARARVVPSSPVVPRAGVRVEAGSPSAQVFSTTSGEPLPARERAVVLDAKLQWWSSTWSYSAHSRMASMEYLPDRVRFKLYEPKRNHIWVTYLARPVDWKKYPIAVVTYRAQNLPVKAGRYAMWIDFGPGPNHNGGSTAFFQREMVADGEIQRMVVDVRKMSTRGPSIVSFAWGLGTEEAVPAVVDLIDIRFEAAVGQPNEAVPVAAQRVQVKVIDPNGHPVSGAKVTANAEWHNWAQSAVTDNTGLVELHAYAGDDQRSLIRVEKQGYVWVNRNSVIPDAGEPITIKLRPVQRYSGRVVDADGNPIAHVGVRLSAKLSDLAPDTWLPLQAYVLTDTDGRWQVNTLPGDVERLGTRYTHFAYLSDDKLHRVPDEDLMSYADGGAFRVMETGVDVTGRVLNERNEPMRNAVVHVGDTIVAGAFQQFRTDAGGTFTLPHMRSGRQYLTISAGGGYQPLYHMADVKSDMQPLEFVMRKGHVARFRIVDSQGEPIRGARLSLPEWEGRKSYRVNLRSNAQGEITWNNVPDGSGKIHITHDDYTSQHDIALSSGETEERVIQLQPARYLIGNVIDDQTGRPIRNFSITAGHPRGSGDSGTSGDICWHRGTRVQGNDYGYKLNLGRLWKAFHLRVDAPGYVPVVSEQKKNEDGQLSWSIRLKRVDNASVQ